MDFDSIIQKIREKATADGKAVFVIVLFFLVMALVRVIFGSVPWYFLFLMVPVFFASLLRPKAGLVAVLFLTVLFERFFTLEGFQLGRETLKLYPLDIALFGVYGSILAKLFFGKIRHVWKAADAPLLIFFFLVTMYFGASFAGFGGSDLAVAFSTWKNYVFYGALFFALPILCESEADVRQLVRYFLLAAILGIIFLLIGVARGEGLWTEFTPLSTEGVRLLAFPHAFYFSLAFLGMFVSVEYWRSNRYRFFIWGAMALWLVGILGSLMRHLWIGMALAALFALVFLMKKNGRRAAGNMIGIALSFCTALFSLGLFLALLFPASTMGETFRNSSQTVIERVVSIGNTYDESISWRGSTWQSAFVELSKNPFLGSGLGLHIPVESGAYRDFIEIRNIHNSWLALLVQMGLLGFFILASVLCVLIWKMFHIDPIGQFLFVMKNVSLTLIIYQGILLLAQPYLETNLMGIFFWITLGMARTIVSFAEEKEKISKSERYKDVSRLII